MIHSVVVRAVDLLVLEVPRVSVCAVGRGAVLWDDGKAAPEDEGDERHARPDEEDEVFDCLGEQKKARDFELIKLYV